MESRRFFFRGSPEHVTLQNEYDFANYQLLGFEPLALG